MVLENGSGFGQLPGDAKKAAGLYLGVASRSARVPGKLILLLLLPGLVANAPLRGSDPDEQTASAGVVGRPVSASPFGILRLPSLFPVHPPSPMSGEPVNGFPNWQERVMHEWINRARVDPAADLAGCGANCPENTGGCYTPQVPLIWNGAAGRSARYHCAEMGRQAFFAHDSACTLVSGINSLYPGSCDGSASCGCAGGTSACNPACTTWSDRIGLFGSGASGEIVAVGYGSVDEAFYGWLLEGSSSSSCSYYVNDNPPYDTNGHRWLILKATNAVGLGYESVAGSPLTRYYTGDFGNGNGPIPKIPSGAHYPQQSSSIDFWANWYDSAAPLSAAVDIDGTCYPMTVQRGSATNGAYKATVPGLGSGCHRYFFSFVDSSGTLVTYPSTGSYGIGTTGCADWDASRPGACASATPAGLGFYPMTPCRILDTRLADGPAGGPAIQPAGTPDRSFTLTGGGCVVPADARAISANVTETAAGAEGALALYPADQAFPGTSTISVSLSRPRATASILVLSGTGSVKVRNSSAGTVQLIVDVNGYFR